MTTLRAVKSVCAKFGGSKLASSVVQYSLTLLYYYYHLQTPNISACRHELIREKKNMSLTVGKMEAFLFIFAK